MSTFSRWKKELAVALVILVFATVSTLGINQYRFGIADQSVMIPFLKASLNNNLYVNDYLLSQRDYYLTYLWNGLGLTVKHLNLDIPTVFFFAYFISLYLTFLAVYLIAITLFKKKEVAFLSLFFLLFSKPTLAGAATLETILLARTTALPILLFSIYFFLREKHLISFFLLGAGFLIHPLTAAYVTVGLLVSTLADLKNIGIRRFLAGLAIFIISASPIFIWKVLRTPSLLNLFYADPLWVKVLRLRLPHHLFPFSWTRDSFFQAGLVLLTFLISWKHRPKSEAHRFILTFMASILAVCVMGIIFSEFLPLSIVLNLQVLRSFKFILFFAMIYFSNYFFAEIRLKKNFFDKLLVAFLSIGIFYGATGWKYAYLAILAQTLFLMLYHFVLRREHLLRLFVASLLVIIIALSGGAYFRKDSFSIANAQEKKWLDVQRWAKQNTSLVDLFIVPYNSEGFRVESERPIYGDWKDGCLAVFNPQFAYEWTRRMKKLGFGKGFVFQEGFKNLTEADFIEIAKESTSHETFLVMFKEREPLDFPIVYRNEKFVVYEIVPIQLPS